MGFNNTPKSLALIPDGNRRWAMKNKLSFLNGYELGVKKFIDFSEWCSSYKINEISVWAFSTDNIKRPKNEVNALFNIYRKTAKDKNIISRLHDNETRFKIIGNEELLPKDLVSKLHNIEKDTEDYSKRTINMLIGYGGNEDLLYAAKKVAEKTLESGKVIINDFIFRNALISSSVSDIDLVIRTSGEERLSGFMPWQTRYAELYFSKKLWPDFSKDDLKEVLENYNQRQRRFGI
jgi:undecaprenyl diphosphate synthase